MITNSHRLNCDFQLTNFLVGSCSTPDGAWALMYAQKLDLEMKIALFDNLVLKVKMKEAKLKETKPESADYYEALIALNEERVSYQLQCLNFEGAKNELSTINKLMDEINPHCKYKDHPLHERLSLYKSDEWAGEFMRRAENMMVANLIGISSDQIDAMRSHPEFETKILPHIAKVGETLHQAQISGDFEIAGKLLSDQSTTKLLEKK